MAGRAHLPPDYLWGKEKILETASIDALVSAGSKKVNLDEVMAASAKVSHLFDDHEEAERITGPQTSPA